MSSLLNSSLERLVTKYSISLFASRSMTTRRLRTLQSIDDLHALYCPVQFFLQYSFMLAAARLLPSGSLRLQPYKIPHPLGDLALIINLYPISINPAHTLRPSYPRSQIMIVLLGVYIGASFSSEEARWSRELRSLHRSLGSIVTVTYSWLSRSYNAFSCKRRC